MSNQEAEECCPRFDPEPWDSKELHWQGKRFVKDRVRSVFHIPLNFGKVMARNVAALEAAGAMPAQMVTLSEEDSLWGATVYLEATKDVPGAQMVTLSGTFLAKVFEGPFKDMGSWIKSMLAYAVGKGAALKKMYFYYTTCPACAKKYGKNYVVILGQV